MRSRIVLAFLLVIGALWLNPESTQAQAPQQKDRLGVPTREQMRQKMNENLLVLMCGSLGAPYIQLGHDISVVVNDGDRHPLVMVTVALAKRLAQCPSSCLAGYSVAGLQLAHGARDVSTVTADIKRALPSDFRTNFSTPMASDAQAANCCF